MADLAGVDRLAAVGLPALREAADAARRAGRPVTVLHQAVVNVPANAGWPSTHSG